MIVAMKTTNGYPYYLDQYIISLYTIDDDLLTIADNPRDLCDKMGISITENNLSNIRAKLRRSRNNGTLFDFKGCRCKVYLIKIT